MWGTCVGVGGKGHLDVGNEGANTVMGGPCDRGGAGYDTGHVDGLGGWGGRAGGAGLGVPHEAGRRWVEKDRAGGTELLLKMGGKQARYD